MVILPLELSKYTPIELELKVALLFSVLFSTIAFSELLYAIPLVFLLIVLLMVLLKTFELFELLKLIAVE
ncbi:hypothetical protein [Methanobrevibacter arboriphilus]|uniref:hypothetical protein n=1 Tax=Methanobrevibacter arboriphilus TaxID=39441 RepID=UPI0021E69B51|nr:hypothetical protein [Methanobrevibacter arboriphilus]